MLIIGPGSRLLYANKEALEMLPALHDSARNAGMTQSSLPPAIDELCDRLGHSGPTDGSLLGEAPVCEIIDPAAGLPCSLRAFYIDSSERGEQPRHIMVLVERIVEKHDVDFTRVQSDYGLTKRETEVMRHICGGMTNREIAEKMFISEYTVKDHIKKIMKTMKVSSRSEIIATLR